MSVVSADRDVVGEQYRNSVLEADKYLVRFRCGHIFA